VIGQLVPTLRVQVLHVDGVAARTHFHCRPPCDLRETGSRGDLTVGVVTEFGVDVVEVAAYLVELVGARARVLGKGQRAFTRCLMELSGSLARREDPRWSSCERLES
jgi:hypothetical protein